MRQDAPQDTRRGDPFRAGVRGLTLVEILFTLFILTIALTASISALTQGLRGVRHNKDVLIATTVVARVMEGEQNKAFDAVAPSTFTVTDLPNAQGEVFVEAYNGSPDIKKVTVRLTLDLSRTRRLTTLMSR